MGRHTLIWPTKGNQLRGPRMPPPRALAAADRDPLVSLPPRVPWRGADTAGSHVCWSSSRTCLLDFASLACGPPLPVSPSTDCRAIRGYRAAGTGRIPLAVPTTRPDSPRCRVLRGPTPPLALYLVPQVLSPRSSATMSVGERTEKGEREPRGT